MEINNRGGINPAQDSSGDDTGRREIACESVC